MKDLGNDVYVKHNGEIVAIMGRTENAQHRVATWLVETADDVGRGVIAWKDVPVNEVEPLDPALLDAIGRLYRNDWPQHIQAILLAVQREANTIKFMTSTAEEIDQAYEEVMQDNERKEAGDR